MQTEYDVIVVGAGGSGLAAACSAAEHGGTVLVLERLPQPGGTTGIAVGSFTASGTKMQRDANIADTVEAHAEDAGKFAPGEIESRNNDELREFFLQRAAETWEWLRGLGLSFVGPSPEPPNRVPRMHNVVPGAKAYVAALQLALARRGGQLICNAHVETLRAQSDRITGVSVLVHSERREYTARRGIILAGGDYSNSADMIATHKGDQFSHVEGINPHALGYGHQLASDAGARMVNMDVTYGPELRFVTTSEQPFRQWLPTTGWRARLMAWLARCLPKKWMNGMIKRLLVTWQHPENALFDDGAILINKDGNRFVNERQWPDREIAVAQQSDKQAYMLLDGRLVRQYSEWPHFISTAPDIAYAYVDDYLRLRPDVTRRVDDLGALDDVFSPGKLSSTVERFNRYVTDGRADDYGREGDGQPLASGPWVLLGPMKAYFTTTEGGAMINQRLQVEDESGRVIPGLYAVGQNGLGGQVLFGHGLHIAWAITSGRLAGMEVMKEEV